MRKTMKLALLICLALLTCALMFTACDSGNENQTPSGTTDGTTDSHVHTFGEWITVKESTTTEKGLSQRYCSECNYTESKPLDLHVHSFGEWTVTTDPTCDKEGTQTRTCACGETEEQTVAPQHKMVAEAYEVAPTCAAAGEKATDKCSVCGYRNIEYFGKPLGHNVLESECTQCDTLFSNLSHIIDYYTDDYESLPYTAINDMMDADKYDVIVKRQFRDWEGQTIDVTMIPRKMFLNSPLKTIVLLDNIKEIHESAFENSQEFTFAQMTTSIEKIENNAFKNCPNLKYIVYSGTIEQWNAIEKGTDWDAGTGNYTVYCSDGEITKN